MNCGLSFLDVAFNMTANAQVVCKNKVGLFFHKKRNLCE